MSSQIQANLTINGRSVAVKTDDERTLLEVLREDLQLTGTKYGCGEGACGACSVLVDGLLTSACLLPAVSVDGASVTTIEGLGGEHPVQRAFHEHHALQCGYCTPGFVMAAISLLDEHPDPSEEEIRHGLEGNLCRCTGYHNIVKAVRAAAQA